MYLLAQATFERLSASTTVHTQRLIAPLRLDLSASDEPVVIDHLNACRANGFEVDVDESAPPTRRLKLRTLPFSKKVALLWDCYGIAMGLLWD